MLKPVLAAMGVVAVLVALMSVGYQQLYGTWVLGQQPERISYCGKDFQRGRSISLAELQRAETGIVTPGGLTVMGHVPPSIGAPLLANTERQSGQCAKTLYLKWQRDQYAIYTEPSASGS